MAAKNVADESAPNITAKLIRGNTYIYKNKFFKRGEEVPVSEELASALEQEVIQVRSSRGGDIIEKDRFRITRGAEARDEDDDDAEEETTKRKPLRRGKPSRSSRL